MNKNFNQWFWFIGGFTLGFTLIAIGHASLPKKTNALSEIKSSKVNTPELDHEFSRLISLESRFVESPVQQKKLKTATLRNARKLRN